MLSVARASYFVGRPVLLTWLYIKKMCLWVAIDSSETHLRDMTKAKIPEGVVLRSVRYQLEIDRAKMAMINHRIRML